MISAQHVEIDDLGLALNEDDSSTEESTIYRCVRELTWVPPRLTGLFDCSVPEPPILRVGEETVDDVTWELQAPVDNMTRFTATVSEHASGLIGRVEAITFVFQTGENSSPVYPYHLNTLIALASGQGRTDLLKQAGDFDLGDEELEQLLTQLDEVLVVDGHSIWRMLKRKDPEPALNDESSLISYDDLDWEAIQSHPKLAQYRTWDQHGSTDTSGLGILLSAIAERFAADVERRRSGQPATSTGHEKDALDDLSVSPDAEDEEATEANEVAAEKRRTSARARAKRQFNSFVKRFVNGISDPEFVRLVGPSVIVPSYVSSTTSAGS